MIKNYFKMALRQLIKNRFYSLINILGLAIGLASCLFIFMYVRDELSYDQFHKNKDRIYRISETFKTGDGTMETGLTPHKLALDLKKNFPEIENVTRIDAELDRFTIKYGEKKFMEEKISSTEPEFFGVFSFPLLNGDPKTALRDPYTVVISSEKAEKYFPDENAMGKVLEFINPYKHNSFQAKVTGVFKTMPANSHFHKDFLLSAATADILIPERIEQLGWTSHFSYLLLSPKADPAKLEKAINKYIFSHYPKEVLSFWSHFSLQSLNDIHLYSHLKEEQEANGDIAYVYIFSVIALFIILLAGINYMNLSTARAINRSREVGVRKVVGAMKMQLIAQFLAESVIITIMALVLAACFTRLALPAFNSLAGKELSFDLFQPGLILAIISATIAIGIFSGSYPAFFLSSFNPVKVLKGELSKAGGKSLLLRRAMVVLQFSISIILIIGTIIIYKQWNYLQDKKLGIASEQVIIIPAKTERLQQQYATFKTELLRNPAISHVTGSRKNLTNRFGSYTTVKVTGQDISKTIPWTYVDNNFFRTFNVPVIKGEDFSLQNRKDTIVDFIVNETAVQLLGLSEPIGAFISAIGLKGKIIGVSKDFNFESLHTPVSPVIFIPNTVNLEHISVKVKSSELAKTINYIQKEYAALDPDAFFSYSFLDDDIYNLYKTEAKFFKVFTTFSGLAIFIACLGIFGLISFTASQRTKEIGIRKVLGASVKHISFLLTKEFIKLVLLANIIAWPVAYYFMYKWLEDFPYRIEMGIWMFIGASVIAFLIALITVSFQAIKAAIANPVTSLRTE